MCSVSKVNELLSLASSPGSVAAAPSVPQIPGVKLKHDRQAFFLIDIREPDEVTADEEPLPLKLIVDATVTMGKLISSARSTTAVDEWKTQAAGKQIVVFCPTGYRAGIVARELVANGYNAAVLMRGLLGLPNPAATIPDLLVILGTKTNAEKMTLAMTACSAAAAAGETVVLALMGDGVCTFLRKGNNKEERSETSLRVEETFVGEPFQPCDQLLTKFAATGNGVVLACTSCVKNRKIQFGSDLLDCVYPMQMPDLLRMLGETKKTLQFM